MNILVTGGFGYLGSHCVEKLFNDGHNVRILTRRVPFEMKEWGQKFEIFQGDISKPDSLSGSCVSIDTAIHFAAVNEIICGKDVEEAVKINGLGTKNILNIAAKEGVKRFIYISTFHVYGNPDTDIITEQICPAPVHNYGITHYLAEMFCRQAEKESGIECVILRLSNGYGVPLSPSVNRWSLVMNSFCREAVEQKKITLLTKGTQKRDFVAIKDIIQAVSLVLSQDKGKLKNGLFNVGGDNSLPIIELAHMIALDYEKLYGDKISVGFAKNLSEVGKVRDFIFSSEKIKMLGYLAKANIHEEIYETLRFCEQFRGW